MNKVILLGNLGADAELKYTQGGEAICTFNIATTERFTSEGEKREKTEWHRLTLWGKRGEALGKYLTKGKTVLVEGSLRYGSYEKEGVKHYTTDITVLNIELVSSPGKKSEESSSDDVPF